MLGASYFGPSYFGGSYFWAGAGTTPAPTATRRELILRAVFALLEDLTAVDGRVYRTREDALALDESPALVITPFAEAPTEDIVGKTEKRLRVSVAIYQRGHIPDSLADSVAAEVHALLMTDPTLGGLAIDSEEDGTEWEFDAADGTACWLEMRYRIWYRHERADLTA